MTAWCCFLRGISTMTSILRLSSLIPAGLIVESTAEDVIVISARAGVKERVFVDCLISKFPFRIREIRTDNRHEFQAKFHWHVEDRGIRHAYIKPASPQLNGKVERFYRSDQEEFYQPMTYKDDVDLEAKTGRMGTLP
jgi:transposase InsO family protein